jgi:hypothetical protein
MIIKKFNEPVTIVVSGGADSALLLYLLLLNRDHMTHIITLTNTKRFYRNVVPSANIVKFCVNATSNNRVTHKIIYANEQADSEFDKIWANAESNIIIAGFTDLPPESSGIGHPVLPPGDFRNQTKPRDVIQGRFYIPFANLHKQEIAEIYKQHNLLDTLFPLTISCEATENVSAHCGNCWWCLERKWGFGKV